MRDLAQQPEAGGVVVEQRQRKQQQRGQPGDRRPKRPEADFRIELLLQRTLLGLAEALPTGLYSTRSIPVVRSRSPLWDNPNLAREVEEGRHILAKSGVDIVAVKDLTDAANKVVAAAKA